LKGVCWDTEDAKAYEYGEYFKEIDVFKRFEMARHL